VGYLLKPISKNGLQDHITKALQKDKS